MQLKIIEIIFLCTPVDTIIPILKIIAPHLKAGAIVTVCGGKTKVFAVKADQISKMLSFISSDHAMTRSEGGMEHASEKLFKGYLHYDTQQGNKPQGLRRINQLWS